MVAAAQGNECVRIGVVDVLEIAAIGLISGGAWLVSPPLGFIVLGAIVLAMCIVARLRATNDRTTSETTAGSVDPEKSA